MISKKTLLCNTRDVKRADTSRRMLPVCSVLRNDNRTSSNMGYFWYGSITYAVLSITWPSVHSATYNTSQQPSTVWNAEKPSQNLA